MSSRTPITAQVSWLHAIPLLMLMAVCVVGGTLLLPQLGAGTMLGMAMVIFLHLMARMIPWHHRAAIRAVKQGEFAKAINHYQESMAFFERHPWLDRYRGLTMLSLSAVSYREMALLGMGMCYGQLGDGAAARRMYTQCLEEFPDSVMAAYALRFLDAARDS